GRGNERVVARVDDERRHRDRLEPWFAAGTLPIILSPGEAVQRRGDDVVECVHRLHPRDSGGVGQTREAPRDADRLGDERAEEVGGGGAVEPDLDGDPGCGEVERRRDRCRRSYDARCAALLASEPVEQGTAAERNADRKERRKRDETANGGEHPADLGVVSRVIRARQAVWLAAASAKMRYDAAPPDR